MNESIDSIIHYWFGEGETLTQICDEKSGLWWSKSDVTDQEITVRFQEITERVAAGDMDHWQQTPRGFLAMILCTDQFPRNMYRGQARSFAYDTIALGYANILLEKQWDQELRLIERVFAYLPFEHSERLEDQNTSVSLYAGLIEQCDEDEKKQMQDYYQFALKHREFIERFRRFPHRNQILGRPSTEEELRFLEQPGSSF